AMVDALARSAGLEWDVRSVTTMGASLRDHLAGNIVPARLRDERWDFVVLQQGPSTLPESRADLRDGAAAFREPIEKAGARAALYMVWPDSAWSRSRFMEDFDRVRDSYALAAHDIGGLFIPAGEAWRSVRARDATLPLFGPDGFHPAPEGTYVAALAIFARLSERPVAGLPGRLEAPDGMVLVNIPAERAAVIQQAVADALAQFGN
ncbi:MAG: hypothetical protein M3Y31_01385, partial [Gemmatimonadota bacterium]|nr:hypothetical protein [Gemmatimonadota bacterium]